MSKASSHARRSRHVSKEHVGKGFDSEATFKEALLEECGRELSNLGSPADVAVVVGGVARMKAEIEVERRHRDTFRDLLGQIDASLHVFDRASTGASVPATMTCSRAGLRLRGPLRDLRIEMDAALNAAAEDALCERLRVGADEDLGVSFALEHDAETIRSITWTKKPAHRKIVFLVLRASGILERVPGSRVLGIASLLAGGETIPFKPRKTTVARAIEVEQQRMLDTAKECDPGWTQRLRRPADVPRDPDPDDSVAAKTVH